MLAYDAESSRAVRRSPTAPGRRGGDRCLRPPTCSLRLRTSGIGGGDVRQPGRVQRHQAVPVGRGRSARTVAWRMLSWRAGCCVGSPPPPGRGEAGLIRRDMHRYATRGLVDLRDSPLRVVVAGNGMPGRCARGAGRRRAVPLPLTIPLYFELDFPTTRRIRWSRRTWWICSGRCERRSGAGVRQDADRCFVGRAGNGLPVRDHRVGGHCELAKHPGATIIHNLITSAAVPEIIENTGNA